MTNRPAIANCTSFPAAAVPDDTAEADFHLTRSPYCSSLLRPDAAALGDWDFARLFDVERTVRVPCVSLSKALRDVGVTRVDWFKTDSQGIDLRLFQSLGEEICSRVLAVEFEPGIIDAYEGEDKMAAVLTAMDRARVLALGPEVEWYAANGARRCGSPGGAGNNRAGRRFADRAGMGRDEVLEHLPRDGPVFQTGLAARMGHRLRERTIRFCPRPVPPCPRGDPRPAVCQPGGRNGPHDSPKAPQPTDGRRRPIGRAGCAVLWPLAAQTGAARRKIVTGEIVTRAKSTMKKRPIDGRVMIDL